jgi:ornithine cyclodeaminase/alanine dehydrogenase-like protein (mu-crystallin family)
MSDVLYLTQADVEAAGVTMAEVMEAVTVGFREHGEGRVEMPPKPGVHSQPNAFIHAMPAWVPALGAVGVKWVGGYPENARRGLPTITGLLILNDDETGLPVAIMDCIWITAKRTGAATALSAKHLARPESEVLGVLGCGVQGRSNVEALREVFPLRRVVGYDVVAEQAERFRADVEEQWGLETVVAAEPREAVSGCDLVVTAGPDPPRHRTIKQGWLEEGAFASLVDVDASWDGPAVQEVDKFTTDDLAQFEHYRGRGRLPDVREVYATLGELVVGKKPGRERSEERTMACNIGAALGDMATATIICRRALERGIGTRLPL